MKDILRQLVFYDIGLFKSQTYRALSKNVQKFLSVCVGDVKPPPKYRIFVHIMVLEFHLPTMM